MNVEVRGDTVVITGYVNAIERYSKPITDTLRNKVQTFIERVKAGVFRTALKRNDDVKVLLNHDMNRELANTKDGSAKLEEDNIGLRAEVTITDAEVVEKARQNKLVGWSFGFYANADDVGAEGENTTRTITDMDLVEVSILDDTKSPAYYGTSIEARCEGGRRMEVREEVLNDEVVAEEQEVQEEQQGIDIEQLADIVANKVVAMLTEQKAEETEEETEVVEEETPEEETEVETEETETEVEETEEEEKRAIDYSAFESRLANL
jgi:HK97 family phage prohead protease